MNNIEVPLRTYELMRAGFVCYVAKDLARDFARSQVAHPGDDFGNVFAWLWERDRGSAVSLFGDLLAEARRAAPAGQEVTLKELIRDLRFALHNTQLSHHSVYDEVERVLETEVPKDFGGRIDS